MYNPDLYPVTHDECICGWYSSNFGNSWGCTIAITHCDNGIDEYKPSIAGSHINDNWVCLAITSHFDILNCYSTDNGTT